ncbi:MAG: nucleotide sugar dehydrogenase [Planctomycetota bacterium]|jgi:UDP-N-acetyl-D-glucosamine dehydrogenase|nr:nucleotide sugar dehydrogenase [Planctomycetota bacterium]
MALTLARIEQKQVHLGIVGLGYVGLPLALTFAAQGVRVTGFDVDPSKITELMAGRSYLRHIGNASVAAAVHDQGFTATVDFAETATCDAVLICVPTPLDPHLQPDLRFVEATCEQIAPHLAADSLVVLESTTWPGTTEEVVRASLEAAGPRRVGVDLHLAYSPEREDPGNPNFGTSAIPKLVGGTNEVSLELTCALYRLAIDQVVPVSSTQVAEAAKLFENVFRAVNIALVNELKVVLDRMGIDVGEVIDAAATKPFGFMPFRPGPGLGGHCIPIDPYYLTWKAREFGISTRFIELAGEINRAMPAWVVGKVVDLLNDYGKALKGSRILLLGLAYKKDVGDMRESPALALIDLLEARGAVVDFNDPYLPEILPSRAHGALAGRRSVEVGSGFDCLVLVTDHSAYSAASLLIHETPIVDTRRVLPRHPLVTWA